MSLSFDRLDQIAASVRQQVAGVPFSELRAGDSIRWASEDGWTIYMICHERGWMRLSHPDHGTEYVPDVDADERFLRGAF